VESSGLGWGPVARLCGYGNEPSGSVKCREGIYRLSERPLALRKDSA
jgi:hypothetical protein